MIDGADFYAGRTAAEWDAMSPAEKASHCMPRSAFDLVIPAAEE